MEEKITKHICHYPKDCEPDYFIPAEYCSHRYALGKKGNDPLVVICMNPSAAKDTLSDMTVNRIIKVSKTLGKEGWMVFNIYPERATNAKTMDAYCQDLLDTNIQTIKTYLLENKISEVWGAWGDDQKLKALTEGRKQMLAMLSGIGVRVYYFGTLTKKGNPRHPLQRYEKWDFTKKEYL